MKQRKLKFFYLPLNREVVFALIAMLILISFGAIEFDESNNERAVFSQHPKAYYQGPNDKKQIALKINVAWGTEYIPQILEILKEKKVKATFFFVGNWVEKFPDFVADIKEAGHALGNHGYRHRHPKKLSEEELINLIKQNEKLLLETTDYKTDLFAPPYGEVDDRVVKIADKAGYKTIMWTLDTVDWQRPDPQVIINRIVPKAKNGAIVLMHPTAPTVKALPQIIDQLEAKEYKLVTIPQLLSN